MLLFSVLIFGILTLWIQGRWALSVFQVALFSLAAYQIARRIRERRLLGLHPVALLLACTVAWGMMQIATGQTVYSLRTAETVLNWVVNLTVFALALEIGQEGRTRENVQQALLVFAALLGIVAVFTVLTSPPGKVFWRFDIASDLPTLGPFVYKNQFAAFMEVILPLALARAIFDPRRRWPYTLVSAMLLGAVIASGSRAGTILCLLEIVAVPTFAYVRGLIDGRVFLRAILGSLAAGALLTAIVGWEILWNRLQEPNPYALRWELVKSSIKMTQDRPWVGFGLGTWADAYPAYARYDDGTFVNQAHNDWVQWAAEGGVPFFAMMLSIAGWTVRPAVRSLWGIGLLSVFAHALVDYPWQQRPALAAFFFAMLGLLAGEIRATARRSPA